MKKSIVIFSVLLLFFACSKKKILAPSEFINYLNSENSGLKVNREFNQINYKLQLFTPEELTLRNISEANLGYDNFKKEFNYYSNKINFTFLIEDIAQNDNRVKLAVFDKEMYGKMLMYANTNLKEDFKLVMGHDTLMCTLVHLEPANSIQPVLRITLGFNGINFPNSEMTLVYNDNLFMSGPIKFHFSKEVFENLPELKI